MLLICSQCKQMVTGGHLPVTLDEAIYISALQLHIEVSQSTRKHSHRVEHYSSIIINLTLSLSLSL